MHEFEYKKTSRQSVVYVLASWTLYDFGDLLDRFGELIRWGHINLV